MGPGDLEAMADRHEQKAADAEKVDLVRALADLAIEKKLARLRVGDIEITPAPSSWRQQASVPAAGPSDPTPETSMEAPERRPLRREPDGGDFKPHPMSYWSSGRHR